MYSTVAIKDLPQCVSRDSFDFRILFKKVRGLRVDRAAAHGTLARGEGTALSLTAGCLFTRCRLAALSVADGAELALGTGNAVVSNNEGLDNGSSAVLVSTGGRVIDDNQG